MRSIFYLGFFCMFFSACRNSDQNIVPADKINEWLARLESDPMVVAANADLVFWQARMNNSPELFVNGPKLLASLENNFSRTGSFLSLQKSDSLRRKMNEVMHNDPEWQRSLTSMALRQHRFRQADSIHRTTIQLEGNSVVNAYYSFDILFELGDIAKADGILKRMPDKNSFHYWFRLAKLEDAKGSIETAIECMINAVNSANGNLAWETAALSNAADFYLHNGDPVNAFKMYGKCLQKDPANFHCLMGVGTIALLHDKNILLAEKMLGKLQSHFRSPEIWLKWVAIAEFKNDIAAQKIFAQRFVQQVRRENTENMFAKSLVDLYTSVLNKPDKALELAEKEINNRATPQTYAWKAWTLFRTGQKNNAFEVYKSFVEGRSLEPLESYYMAVMLEGLNKKKMAGKYFDELAGSRFELSPAKWTNSSLEH